MENLKFEQSENHSLSIREDRHGIHIIIDGVRLNMKFGSVKQAENFIMGAWMELFIVKGIFAGSN